jgi:hypothetical protein
MVRSFNRSSRRQEALIFSKESRNLRAEMSRFADEQIYRVTFPLILAFSLGEKEKLCCALGYSIV